MTIAIIGTGYIGLVSGVCLAHIGHTVTCVDNNAAKLKTLRDGIIPIYEPGLEILLHEVVGKNLISFTDDVAEATRQNDFVMIAVGTPTDDEGETTDLSYVLEAARQIAMGIERFKVVIVKSTVPAGTCQRVDEIIRHTNPKAEFAVVSNPEFLREGAAVVDFMNPDRIVIGTESERARTMMFELYRYFETRNFKFLVTSLASAELIKFASNAFLATKIAFINEVAELCEKTGARVADVAKGMGLDERIGPKFLQSGPGFGGSCFPKDLRGLAASAKTKDVTLHITNSVIASNTHTKNRMVDKIVALAGGSVRDQVLTIFGVTFKPDTDDMREAPALTIIPALQAQGAKVHVVDPQGRKDGEALLGNVDWFEDPYRATENADMIVVLTEWQQFRQLDLTRLAKSMHRPTLADLRNVYSDEDLRSAGFTSFCRVGARSNAKADILCDLSMPTKP
jgi:UDPglucose 6-dehydrogenase